MTEAVQVFVRCRPMNSREKELKSKKCITVDKKLLQIEINRPSQGGLEPKAFTFDGVYDDDSLQKQVSAVGQWVSGSVCRRRVDRSVRY